MHFKVLYFIRNELAFFILRYLPCHVKVYTLGLIVAPPSINRGTEDSVLAFLQSGEAVYQEALET